ncbi:hypothetical protein ACWD5V_34670 [Streptomyces sp. NPDC002523]
MAAPAIFKSLPGPSLGAIQYAERLYGPVPRCLAYLTSRGKRRGGPSLLKLETGLFTPAGIGSALIDLTGRAQLLDSDQTVRHDLAQGLAQLAEMERENENALLKEEQALLAVDQRDKARADLTQANNFWRLHYARGLLDVLARRKQLTVEKDSLQTPIQDAGRAVTHATAELEAVRDTKHVDQEYRAASEAQQRASGRLEEARNREAVLKNDITRTEEQIQEEEREAVGAHGTLDDARHAAVEARQDAITAEVNAAAAQSAHTTAVHDVERAERGHYGQAGRAVEILTAAGIEAVGLLDGLDLPANQRARWEARLALYRDAVCVDADQADLATTALAALPGAVLVLRRSGRSARSPAFAPPALRAFLHTLAERLQTTTNPVAALDEELGLRVLGGFPQPLTGRSALLERMRRAQEEARAALGASEETARLALKKHADADLLVRRLEHAERAGMLRERRRALESEIAGGWRPLSWCSRSRLGSAPGARADVASAPCP